MFIDEMHTRAHARTITRAHASMHARARARTHTHTLKPTLKHTHKQAPALAHCNRFVTALYTNVVLDSEGADKMKGIMMGR